MSDPKTTELLRQLAQAIEGKNHELAASLLRRVSEELRIELDGNGKRLRKPKKK